MNLQEQILRIQQIMESKGWGDSNKVLSKSFKFEDFKQSIVFINKVAKIAEKQNHHPKITLDNNKVTVSITDHEEGGVSKKCHKFADVVDKIDIDQSEIKEGELTEKCWPGYTKKGMKTMFGKRYPNCVKVKK